MLFVSAWVEYLLLQDRPKDAVVDRGTIREKEDYDVDDVAAA